MAQDDYTKLQLRVPKDLHAKVQASASASGKSLNAEFIVRIESSFSAAQRIADLESVASALASGNRSQEKVLNYQHQLLCHAGLFIGMLYEFGVEKKPDEELREFDACIKKFGAALSGGEHENALTAIGELDSWARRNNLRTGDFDLLDAYIRIRQAYADSSDIAGD